MNVNFDPLPRVDCSLYPTDRANKAHYELLSSLSARGFELASGSVQGGREGGAGEEGAIRAGEWVARVAVKLGLDLDAIAKATVRQSRAAAAWKAPEIMKSKPSHAPSPQRA